MASDYPSFNKVLEKLRAGESSGIVMHVDTVRLLKPQEWIQLKEAGVEVVIFERSSSEPHSSG
jgi:hypothetical protein